MVFARHAAGGIVAGDASYHHGIADESRAFVDAHNASGNIFAIHRSCKSAVADGAVIDTHQSAYTFFFIVGSDLCLQT